VNLKEVRHIDGSGVSSLMEAYHCALCNGIGFSFTAPSRQAVRVLELSQLHQVSPYPWGRPAPIRRPLRFIPCQREKP
jgi:anti-anti-sigma regulatory factor